MTSNSSRRFWLLLAFAGLLAPAAWAQPAVADKEKEKDKSGKSADGDVTRLKIEVTAGAKDEGVDSASVYVKFQKERLLGKDRMIEMNVKTNREGVARVPTVPRGKVLVQVIAPGWKTFGKWYDLDEADVTIKIKLEKPPRWY